MKFSLNGALTIGTLDGANVEIREEVGPENFFLFGLTAAEVAELKARGYRPRDHYEQNADAARSASTSSPVARSASGDTELFRPLVENLLDHDPFLVLADYQAYIDAQDRVSALWRDPRAWTRKSILNVRADGQILLRPLDPRLLRTRMEGAAWPGESMSPLLKRNPPLSHHQHTKNIITKIGINGFDESDVSCFGPSRAASARKSKW